MEIEKILSETAECFDFDKGMLFGLDESIKEEIAAEWEKSHDIAEVYMIIRQHLQIMSIKGVAELLTSSPDELKAAYDHYTISQMCGAYEMMNGIESNSYIIEEINRIKGETA